MRKIILASISAASLFVAGLVNANNFQEDLPNDGGVFICEDTGEEGPIFYPAEYSTEITNEPNYSTQNSYTFSTMSYNNAHKYYRGDSVKVAVIDSGLNYTHEDFKDSSNNQIIQGNSRTIDNSSGSWLYYQFSSGYQSKIVDSLGHGTNVASVIASQINALGCAGIAPNVELYIYKVTNTSNGYEWTAINSALSYCISEGIDVINMSFQAYEHAVTYNGSTMSASTGCSSVMTSYINSCYNAGITLVAAAGNYNTSEPSYPGNNNHVICVGSLAESSTTTKAEYSNTTGIDLVAPGTVYVADKGTNTAYRKNSGTSFSAPVVTAAIALYKQQNPSATPAQIESALYASCDSISGNPSWAGNGRLNIDKFLGVEDNAPTEVVVNNPEVVNEELSLEVGDTFDLDWTVNGNGTFDHSVNIYALEDNGVLSVNSSGHITALSQGSDYIVIESNADPSIYASIYVTVTASATPTPTVSSVSVSPSSISLDLSGTKTRTLNATVNGTNNPSQEVTWNSDNTSVATVNSSGLVTGVGTGSATITATSVLDNTQSGTCTVTVSDSSAVAEYQWQLVESAPNDWSGQYILCNGTSGTVKMMNVSEFSSSSFSGVDVTVSSKKITASSEDAITIEPSLAGTNNKYTITANGYWIGRNTNSNGVDVLVTTGNYTSSYDNSLSYGSNKVTIAGNGGRTLTWFGSNSNFRYYSSSNNCAQLFKKIENKTLSTISVKTAPTKISYEEGETFDPTGLVITKTFSDSSTQDVSYASESANFSFTPTTSTALTTSNTSVTISYGGKTTSQAITVTAAKTLSSISITGYNTAFVEGDAFSFGGTVTAHYSDSTSANVTSSASYTGYSMTALGNHTVTVSYTHKTTTKTATYTINVAQGILSSIAVSGQTTEYIKNHQFSFDGICTSTFENGYQKAVTPTSITAPDMTTSGDKTIIVSYTYNGLTKTTSYSITVSAYREVIEETSTSIYCMYDFSSISGTSEISSTATLQNCYSSSGGITTASVSSRSKTYAADGFVRLATGSASGSVAFTFGSVQITNLTIVAKGWSASEKTCTLSITNGGSVTTTSDTTTDTFNVSLTSPQTSITLSASSNNRIKIRSVTFYHTTTSQEDIGHSEDCVGLETFIDTYMHMDYVQNLAYCKDSEHHYYSSAKSAFNALNEHQRSLFTTNSAYITEWTRLSTWASKNGDSLNGSNQLAAREDVSLININQTNKVGIILIISLISFSSVGAYIFIKYRKEEK